MHASINRAQGADASEGYFEVTQVLTDPYRSSFVATNSQCGSIHDTVQKVAFAYAEISSSLNDVLHVGLRRYDSRQTNEVSMSGKITVLVVEDEALLRLDTVYELIDHGFEVMEAGNAQEAINFFMSGNRFECLFTDVDMPGDKDGLELAEVVKSTWPPIEIIVTSGHRDVKPDDLPQDGVFVGKPYNPETIADLIRRLTAA